MRDFRSRLTVRWGSLDYPKDRAEYLSARLNDLRPDFRAIGVDVDLPEYRKRRFWEETPRHSLISKTLVFDEPTWKIGYEEDPDYTLSLKPRDFILPPRGPVTLLFTPPNYTQTYAINQSLLEHVFVGPSRTFPVVDDERLERCLRVLYEALYSLGMHPEGPDAPVSFEWGIGY